MNTPSRTSLAGAVAQNDALKAALAFVLHKPGIEGLKALSKDVLLECYNAYPVTASPQEFLDGHGNWGLAEPEFRAVQALAVAYVAAAYPDPTSLKVVSPDGDGGYNTEEYSQPSEFRIKILCAPSDPLPVWFDCDAEDKADAVAQARGLFPDCIVL